MDKHFDSLIKPLLDQQRPRRLLEIGVCQGATTLPLLRWCRDNDARLTSLDPVGWLGDLPDTIKPPYMNYVFKYGEDAAMPEIEAPYLEAAHKEGLFDYWDCQKTTSLDYLKNTQERFDAAFVDGDHNYYTVYNEITHIDRLLNPGGSIFLHDVADKWSRVDQYYDVRAIPAEFVNGPKAGILTAIEDFLAQTGGIKEGRLANAEELSAWLEKHPTEGAVERLKSALRVVRRGYDNVWLHREHLAFQVDNPEPYAWSGTYAFRILSGRHFGLGLLVKARADS